MPLLRPEQAHCDALATFEHLPLLNKRILVTGESVSQNRPCAYQAVCNFIRLY